MGSLAAQLDLLPRVKHSVASVARLLEVSSEVVLQALQVRGSRWMKIEKIREKHAIGNLKLKSPRQKVCFKTSY